MLPVCHCSFGLLRSVRGIAALTWIAVLLLSPLVSRAHERHNHGEAALAALNSSAYPRVPTQSKLHKVVDILKGDRLLIYLDHVAANECVIAVAEPRLRRLRSLAEDDAVPRSQVTGHGLVWRQA
jgi:hypothetical protein